MAVSPMLPKYTAQLVRKLGLTYPVLNDHDNGVAEMFRAVMTVPPALQIIYLGLGIDLARFNGEGSWRLPLAGRIVVDKAGVIRDVDLHPDHTTRPEPQNTLQLLRQLVAGD